MNIGQAINTGVVAVTKEWTKYRKKEFRDFARGQRAFDQLMLGRVPERSVKAIAYEVMADAYSKASGGGALPASARQIMYQARPLILAQTDKPLGKDFDQYFTQQLLPGYLMENPDETAGWDVVFDARGHLWEPHTGREIQLGTLAVRDYLVQLNRRRAADLPHKTPQQFSLAYPTHGPAHRYQNVLFIEKEGFMPLLARARIAERFDLAIMSTKGLASTAARSLMEGLSDVRFLDTWRYQFETPPDVVDLGLRLADVKAEGLVD